ncbi:NAD(P)-dependent oxidoreductase [Methylomonas sp. LL1]|uniref:NAD(P)-dependent oxidoreductase n=1 Tax=Methylomonas sp. LL1 TaxID=2785785 RepID=UPI0018C3BA03|nr:NAD(P)-dependent oxidoreductase [Methylomonas sp. LL1]QPK62020.1 NAD(P)-dependent oxidoreductase [Methylomonas sp. LL1]
MTQQRYKLGFIGIGLMGKPMVLRLLAAGFEVNVWNRSAGKLAALEQGGARVCENIAELMMRSDVILLCLADTAVVETLVEQQILPCAESGKLVIDLSSIDPETSRQLAVRLKQSGMHWVDAPVSGGTAGAEQGTLAIMAGGDAEDIAVARQVLKPLYSRLTHMGPVGSGQTTKICNQMIVGCNVLVIAEMMALAQQAGVDSAKIPEALAGGFADSKPLQIIGPEMAADQFEPVKWRVKTLLKDLNMAVELAAEQGNAIPMSGLAAQMMQLHGGRGFLEQDPSTLIKLYRKV